MAADLHVIHETSLCDHVAKLRELADAIEAGAYGDVGCLGVVLLGDTCEVFGFGRDSAAPSVAMLLHAGFMKLSRAVADWNEKAHDAAR